MTLKLISLFLSNNIRTYTIGPYFCCPCTSTWIWSVVDQTMKRLTKCLII